MSIGLVSGVDAAPSVRVLGSSKPVATTGSNTTGVKATGVNTGDNIKPSVLATTAGAKKSASAKGVMPGVSKLQPVARAASNRGASAGTATAATASSARFPGIASKSNIQKSFSTVTTPTGGAGGTGYNLQEMADQIANKVDTATLEQNYYKKDEVDNIHSNYYTSAQVDAIVSGIDTSASSPYITWLTGQVNTHTGQIGEILATQQAGGIYDMNSGETKSVYFVTSFDADSVLGTEETDGD